jgi:hypothetical protein
MSISYSSSLTNQLTPWNQVLLEKPPVAQLLKKLSTLYETRKFITVFTRARHWSISWDRWIQSIPSQPIHYPPTSCLGTASSPLLMTFLPKLYNLILLIIWHTFLSQLNSVHILTTYLRKIYFRNILKPPEIPGTIPRRFADRTQYEFELCVQPISV